MIATVVIGNFFHTCFNEKIAKDIKLLKDEEKNFENDFWLVAVRVEEMSIYP